MNCVCTSLGGNGQEPGAGHWKEEQALPPAACKGRDAELRQQPQRAALCSKGNRCPRRSSHPRDKPKAFSVQFKVRRVPFNRTRERKNLCFAFSRVMGRGGGFSFTLKASLSSQPLQCSSPFYRSSTPPSQKCSRSLW